MFSVNFISTKDLIVFCNDNDNENDDNDNDKEKKKRKKKKKKMMMMMMMMMMMKKEENLTLRVSCYKQIAWLSSLELFSFNISEGAKGTQHTFLCC